MFMSDESWKIQEGDFVRVDFNNAQFTLVSRGEVLGYPWATGDSWKIRDTKTGDVHYISEGCTHTKLKKE
jgi:hypothetical protein